jgi:chromosome segregation ATPase
MMKNKRVLLSMTILLLLLNIAAPIMPALSDTLTTDAPKYTAGQTVTITGEGTPSTEGSIDVKHGEESIQADAITTSETGEFTYSLDLAEDAAYGDYTVTIVIADTTNTTGFKVVSDEEALCDSLIPMVEDNKAQAEELLSTYSSDDEDKVQDLNEKMAEADTAYADAQTLIEDENYDDAADKLNDALSLYGEVISEVQDEEVTEDEESYDSTSLAIELQGKIDRLLGRADSLEQRAQRLDDEGIDVDEALSLIGQAKDELSDAQSLIGSDVEEATQLVDDAKQKLDDANDVIKDANKVNTVELALRFMDKAQIRAEKQEQQINHLMQETHASPTAINAVTAAFERIYEHMLQIKGSINLENLEEMLDEVEDTSDELEDTYKHVGNSEERLLLKDIQKLEAQIEAINETLIKLGEQGEDTTELSDALEGAKQDLEDAEALVGTDNSAARDLVTQAEDTLNGVKDSLNNYMSYSASHMSESGNGHGHAKDGKSKKGDEGETTGSPEEEPE